MIFLLACADVGKVHTVDIVFSGVLLFSRGSACVQWCSSPTNASPTAYFLLSCIVATWRGSVSVHWLALELTWLGLVDNSVL